MPDNPRYEGSDLLWFDEHNHPVDGQKIDRSDPHYQLRRCYKLVSLLHLNQKLDFFFVVGARVISGRRHECPILYQLVEGLVNAVGREVMKILIVDRGLIDGASMGRLKKECHIDTIVPVRTNMDLYADILGLTRSRDFRWEPLFLPRLLHGHRPSHNSLCTFRSGKQIGSRPWRSAKLRR